MAHPILRGERGLRPMVLFVRSSLNRDLSPNHSGSMDEPRSQPDPTTAFYTGASGREYHEGKRALAPEALGWLKDMRAAKFQPHVRPHHSVFELGVAAGWNLAGLRCAEKIGTDVADFLAAPVKAAGIRFVNHSAEVPSRSVDVTICHHVLEHLLEPATGLRELQRLLKPGGVLLLYVPWERELRYRLYRPEEPNHHLYTWNAQTLGNLVSVSGFRIDQVRIRRYGYDRFAANLAAKVGLGAAGFRALRALMIAVRPNREVELIAVKD